MGTTALEETKLHDDIFITKQLRLLKVHAKSESLLVAEYDWHRKIKGKKEGSILLCLS